MQRYGGVSRYFVELIRQFSAWDDVEAHVLAPYYVNAYLHELECGGVDGRHVANLPRGASSFLQVANRIVSSVRVRRQQPDVLHETYYSTPLPARTARKGIVVTVYDMIHELYPQYFASGDSTTTSKRRAVQRADQVICISEQTRKDLLQVLDVDPDKARTIHIGFEVPELEVGPSIVDGPYLLYVGVRGGYKNFSSLVEALAGRQSLLRDYRLVAFGGAKPDEGELAKLASSGIARDRFLWFGGSDRTLRRLYRHASAFIYPSLYEGFGIPPLEAMGQGCPVVCSRAGSIVEVVGDAGEYFSPEDPDDIANAITRAIDPATAGSLQKRGFERIRKFSWSNCAKQTREVYSGMM